MSKFVIINTLLVIINYNIICFKKSIIILVFFWISLQILQPNLSPLYTMSHDQGS